MRTWRREIRFHLLSFGLRPLILLHKYAWLWVARMSNKRMASGLSIEGSLDAWRALKHSKTCAPSSSKQSQVTCFPPNMFSARSVFPDFNMFISVFTDIIADLSSHFDFHMFSCLNFFFAKKSNPCFWMESHVTLL